MIWKLSLSGIKSRFKDYAVLFSGLVVASMIFNMFMTLATNNNFMEKDIKLDAGYLNFIFGFGAILLAIIMIVYLVYANTFLLSMRKHDYGMFMMLGAKSSRIGLLIFVETLLTGLLATALGIVLSFGLIYLIVNLLVNTGGLEINNFQLIYPKAILVTLIFFILVFLFSALRNAHKLMHSKVIDLLHEDQKPVKLTNRPVLQFVEAIVGLVFLIAAYYSFANIAHLTIFVVVPLGLVTVVVGSYLIFKAFFTTIISFLLKKKNFSYRGIRSFTLGQLKFRLQDYTKILTITSILFALALGAITVGLNFNTAKDQAKQSTYYDAIVTSKAPQIKKYLAKISIKSQQTYHYKETGKKIYFNKKELTNHPVKTVYMKAINQKAVYLSRTIDTKGLEHGKDKDAFLQIIPGDGTKDVKLVSTQKLAQIKGQTKFVSLINVHNFDKDYQNLSKIEKIQIKNTPGFQYISLTTKPLNYMLALGVVSGFEFMGFFLGIAFLTMLASTLMFKVLSGATSDKLRYKMLDKIGARKGTLKKSIAQEIGSLFILPGILGIADVLFGLQMFKPITPQPYNAIWIPFVIFIVLYFFYYVLTVKLYEKIVLARD